MEKSKHEKRKDQEVPLVLYKGGERIEIGRAIVKGDGSIIAQIAKDVRKEFTDLFTGSIGDISLNPKLSIPPDMKYHVTSVNDTRAELGVPPKP